MHKLQAMGVFDFKFGRNLNEVAVSFAQLVALQVFEIVVFVRGEDFLFHDEIVGFKKLIQVTVTRGDLS